MAQSRWAWAAVGAVVAWVVAAVLAVAVAADDEDGADVQVATQADYALDLAECEQPQETAEDDPQNPPVPVRRAEGTLTNETDERRSFRLLVAFETQESVRVDFSPTVVDELGPGETALWEAVSYLDRAGEQGVTCQVAAVEYPSAESATTGAGAAELPPVPPVVFSNTDNVDETGPGEVADIDAVSYICYVVNPRVPVSCGMVTN